jgi:signal transduction histidine kinase
VETIAQALKIPYAAIEVQSEVGSERLAWYGYLGPDEPFSRIPLTVQGVAVGQLNLGTERLQDVWPQGKQEMLKDLIRQVSIAVQSVRLTKELHRSRERIVTAREEERRRLRRDLHDGLGSNLASMMLRLDEAVQVHEQDSVQSMNAIRNVQAQMRTSLDDIRRLVYKLRPPILDELGLGFALQELAVQFQDRNLQVLLDGVDEPFELSAAAEVAIYRIVQEALTNVVRHAQASRCSIQLRNEEQAVLLVIQDNGTGVIQASSGGFGIRSMRERAEELGGRYELDARSGEGTRIKVRIPIAGGISA